MEMVHGQFRLILEKTKRVKVEYELLQKNDFSIKNHKDSFEIISTKEVQLIRVYDLMGRLLIHTAPNQRKFNINTSTIKKGTVLIINAVIGNKEVSKKVIKY